MFVREAFGSFGITLAALHCKKKFHKSLHIPSRIFICFFNTPFQYCSLCRCSKLLHRKKSVIWSWWSIHRYLLLLAFPLHRQNVLHQYQLEGILFREICYLDTTLSPCFHSVGRSRDNTCYQRMSLPSFFHLVSRFYPKRQQDDILEVRVSIR